LELDLGRDNLDRAVKVYFNTWKFRHPYPEDFQSILEKEMNKNLTPYFELLKKKGNL
jgi:aminopeptidase N